MAMSIRVEAGEDTRWAADAFERVVGTVTTVRMGTTVGAATIVAAQVVDDGCAAIITIDLGTKEERHG